MTQSQKNSLSTYSNSHRTKDYIVSLVQEFSLNQRSFTFGLRYVPDKLLLCHTSLASYLEQSLTQEAETAEAQANEILEDIVDIIVPRWIEITLKLHENILGQDILITVEEMQPNWDNHALLHRLAPLF